MEQSRKLMAYNSFMSVGRPATKPTPAFGERLAVLRRSKGWTQPELAKRMGLSVKTVTYYEREAVNPTARTITRCAEVFGMKPEEFIKGVSKPPSFSKSGPPSRLETIFSKVSRLPRSKQKLIADMLEGVLEKAS